MTLSPDDAVAQMNQKALLGLAADSIAPEPPRNYRAPTVNELGVLFPDLEVVELLGTGGMGCVFKAKQRKLDRTVALKILPRELARDDLFAERFSREARAMARLNHPNIVSIYDFGQAGDVYFLTMEYMDGMNLRELIDTGSLDPSQAVAIFIQVCHALAFAHAEGVIHRDIKPENILFTKQGHVALADFGLARLALDSNCEVSLTQTRQAMGTLNYMAPEQYEEPKSVDHRADIYAMGVLMYELMTGKVPRGSFPPVSSLLPDAPNVDAVINKALQVSPQERYGNVQAMLQHLQANVPELLAQGDGNSITFLNEPGGNGTFTKLVNVGAAPFRAVNRLVKPARPQTPTAANQQPAKRWLPLHKLTYITLALTIFLMMFPWGYRYNRPALAQHDPNDFPLVLVLPLLAILSQLAKYRKHLHPLRWFVMTFFCFFMSFMIGGSFHGNTLQTTFLILMGLLAFEFALVIFDGVRIWFRSPRKRQGL